MKIKLSVELTKEELDNLINSTCLKCPRMSGAGDYSKCGACWFRKAVINVCDQKGLDWKKILGED